MSSGGIVSKTRRNSYQRVLYKGEAKGLTRGLRDGREIGYGAGYDAGYRDGFEAVEPHDLAAVHQAFPGSVTWRAS